MTDLLTELEALAKRWDEDAQIESGAGTMSKHAAILHDLIAAEKARVPENEPDNDILYDQRPDPLLVRAREALKGVRRHVETEGNINLQIKVAEIAGAAIAALDARLGGKT